MPHEISKRSRSKSLEESGKERHHRHKHRSSSETAPMKQQSECFSGGPACQTTVDSKKESGPSCENCSASVLPVGTYCLACDLVLCQVCDHTVHAPPALSKHDRRPFEEASLRRKACRFHVNQQVTHFCLHCNTFLCKICLDEGLHQISPHSVDTLDEAIQKKSRGLLNLVNGPLRQRYETLQHETVRIEGIMQKIRHIAGEIEAQIREHYEGILARLSRSEKEKLALCQSDLTTVKTMMKQIDDVEQYLVTNNNKRDPIVLLSQSGTITESIRSILARKLCDTISVTEENIKPGDLPRELSTVVSREIEEDTGARDTRNSQCILKLNTSSNPSSNNTVCQNKMNAIIVEAEQEILHWKSLVEQYAFELSAWDMVCSHCGERCLPETVNAPCILMNKPLHKEDKGIVEDICSNGSLFQEDFENYSRRHFFVRSECYQVSTKGL